MDDYIEDPSQYVYWSTPPRQCQHAEIQKGKRAYIWRTRSKSGPRGIIAIGTVAEAPRQWTPSTAHLFARRERLDVGEEAASSKWKTGISIDEVRTRGGMLTAEELERISPRLNVLKNPRSTVFRVNEEQHRQIEAMWQSRKREMQR
jgi:EVE domain-containing protein